MALPWIGTVFAWIIVGMTVLMTSCSICIQSKSTALHFAAVNGREEAVRVLIAHGANVNAVNTFGNTPLHEAASGDNPSIVQMLLDAGKAYSLILRSFDAD